MDFEFIYGSETVYVSGSIGYSGGPGDYFNPSFYEQIYNPEDLEITVSGEYESYDVKWPSLDREFKNEILKQITERL